MRSTSRSTGTPSSEPNAPSERVRHTARRRRRLAALGAVALVAVPALATGPTAAARDHGPGPSAGSRPDGSVIWEWNATAMDVLTPSGRPLLTQPFVVTAMHVAMYDAVMAIEEHAEPFATVVTAPLGASSEAAAATAAHRVLVGFLPEHAAVFDSALAESLAGVSDGPAETAGVAVGEAAGWGTLASRLGDGTQSGPLPPALPPGPGVWAPTPPAIAGLTPWLATATPYVLHAPDQFRPAPPPDIGSGRFRRALDELRRIGGATSTARTAEQTAIARFWADQPITQGQRALRAKAQALGGDIAQTARLFAAVMTSQADAIIACWDAKYTYQFWRPWQSVPTVEAAWTPMLATPNHPEYPSAHGCVTGSMAHALSAVLRTHRLDMDIDAANVGVTRHYDTLEQLLDEVASARIWGGLHYRFSTETGLRLAEQVVHHNLRRNFRLVHG